MAKTKNKKKEVLKKSSTNDSARTPRESKQTLIQVGQKNFEKRMFSDKPKITLADIPGFGFSAQPKQKNERKGAKK